jgi:hypothetical protein
MTNKGKGAARNIYVDIEDNSTTKELNFDKKLNIDNIPANEKQVVNIPIKGTLDLTSGKANIKVSFNEAYGFQPDPFEIYIETKELIKPNMKVVDYVFLSEDGKIRRGLPVQLKVLVQNIGKGTAEDVSVNFQYPSANVFPNSQKEFILGIFQPGETKEVVFEFIANKLYSETFIPINTEIVEKYGLFSENKKVFATIDEKFSTNTSINIVSVGNPIEDKINIPIASLTPEVDINIPITDKINENRYALIIGNKDYTKYQTNLNSESNVDFADRDAEIFAEYCEKTLGMPKENIFLLKDAISSQMNREIEKLSRLAFYSNGKAELIFYYAGHGFPDEKTKESYIMPVDISGSDVTSGIKLSYLYKKLTENPVKSATVFLDACFSGGGRNQGLLAARGVRIQPKENLVQGNLVVFSASTGEQSSLPYKEKQHGMFTYFLLKKLQESKGNVTYDELSNYIKTEVQLNSVKINSKDQNPQTLTSPSLSDEWKMWNLK